MPDNGFITFYPQKIKALLLLPLLLLLKWVENGKTCQAESSNYCSSGTVFLLWVSLIFVHKGST